MVRAMHEIQLKDRKRSKDMMLCLNETVDLLAMVNSVHWCGHVLRREGFDALRIVFDFELEGQRKKGKSKRT